MPQVILDLSHAASTAPLKHDQLIHQQEFDQIKIWIEENLQKVNIKNETHSHEAITVYGSRGSGKTTFLLSLKDEIESERHQDIVMLGIIDPTLIEEKAHIFLNVISIINEHVESAFDQPERNTDEVIRQRKEWDDLLNELAYGLPSIEGVGGNNFDSSWQDAGYIMDKGLKAVTSAHNMRKLFTSLVNLALEYLGGKKMFVIIFDDVDIDFKKGWPVLEMIRKYFADARILTIISGDMELYNLSVRNQYLKSLNDKNNNSKNEIYHDPSLERLLTQMSSQYLLKVLRPDRRVYLSTLKEKLDQQSLYKSTGAQKNIHTSNSYIHIKDIDSGENGFELTSYYEALFERFGIENSYQSETYYAFLLSLPLRTQIQFLTEFASHKGDLSKANFLEAFLSDLLERKIDINLITKVPSLLNVEILKFLLSEHSLAELYQLQPVSGDVTVNSCLVALTMHFVQKCYFDPFLIFDYFIKVGYVKNLLPVLGYMEDPKDRQTSNTISVEGICKHAGVFQNKVTRDIVADMTAYLIGAFTNHQARAGFIPIMGLGVLAKQSQEEVADRIDVVFRNASPVKKVLGFIPLSICAYTYKNQTIPCYSVYTLLGTIGELIKKVQLNDLQRGLIELSQVRTYSVPQFRGNIDISEDLIDIDTDTESPDSTQLTALTEDVDQWVASFPRSQAISPHLLGKISTRFFFALNTIESKELADNLGEMMHIRIMALLNAILVEEARERIPSFRGFNINNVTSSSNVFLQNLKASNAKIDSRDGNLRLWVKLPFARWILSCPLLLCYLKPERQLNFSISEFTSFPLEYLSEHTLYHFLKQIKVRSNSNQRAQKTKKSEMSLGEVVELLKSNKTPFVLFSENANQKTRLNYNKEIRRRLGNLIGEPNWSPGMIRKLRSYIKENGIKW